MPLIAWTKDKAADTGTEMPGQPIPFESQFFNDGEDVDDDGPAAFGDAFGDVEPEVDSGPMRDGEEADNLLAGTTGAELRTTKRENVHFAKKAKRVDVKRLKDDIWEGLKGLVGPSTTGDGGDETADEVSRGSWRPTG